MNRSLLRSFLRAYPFQPATALWRASEINALAGVSLPPGLGLDVGCGDGRLSRILIQMLGDLRLVGLDVDPHETELARHESLYERVHTSGADSIAELDSRFDYAISLSVLEHIPAVESVIAEIARVLRPGGKLVVTVPSVGFHACLRGPLVPGRKRERYLADLDRRVAHLRYWSASQWSDVLTAGGFQNVDVTPIMSRSVVRRWETLSRMTAGLLYVLTRGKAPIEIQRSLGLRKPWTRMPAWLAGLLAPILSLGVDDTKPQAETLAGCILIVAERR